MSRKKKFPKWLNNMEVDNEERVITFLKKNISEYNQLLEKAKNLSREYPVLEKLLDTKEGCAFTAEEHRAFLKYKNIHNQIELLERKGYYVMGKAEAFYYRGAARMFLKQSDKKKKGWCEYVIYR